MTFASLKRLTSSSLKACASALGNTRLGRAVSEQVVEATIGRTRTISHRSANLSFCVPNRLNHFRIQSFFTKEPETLRWIESIPEGSVLWDIGANVGLYACFAAKARQCRVVAFEPSVFNLELLARNTFLNQLTDRIVIIPLPLFDRTAESTLKLTTTSWGGALSAFGVTHGFDGCELDTVFELRTVGLPMDDIPAKLGVTPPDYVKMDVDGIEHLILRGGTQVLRGARGILVEINDDFAVQAAECQRLLDASGFRLVSKTHSELIASSAAFGRTYNQIWAR